MNVAEEYIEHNENMYRLGFRFRSLIPTNSFDANFREADKKHGFENRILSSDIFSPPMSIEVVGPFVKMIFHKEREVIVIENPDLAVWYRQVFEILWKLGKDY